ncbi:FtsX-like permease family protein [Streptomyces alkaliterrae]|uniref:FtsX-like permease family protein n=1 Tax=Streptomyces alkaliterrae TaxID=2213162 RepID=A0A5P0YL99_9ACTN|nr:FtsX-like permease family protein [Streptomyces alkaliterrae]MBB1257326.1 FtsX-like permease family protein [Streptomyces alkaliterrae]MQS01066.1 FtsX-like permease family protein [Streptomyces alkaliterrae]
MLRATLRSLAAHRGRLLLSALAVLLSVAFVVGSVIFSDTVRHTFDRLFAASAADVTVLPRDAPEGRDQTLSGAQPTLPAALAAPAAEVEGVADARPEVRVQNVTVVGDDGRRIGSSTGAPTIATGWYPEPRRVVELAEGRPARGDREALLDRDSAERHDVSVGDRLRIVAEPATTEVEVVGLAAFTTTNPGATLVFVDPDVAARLLLGDAERATSIAVTAAEGVPHPVLRDRVAAALGEGYTYRTAEQQSESAAEELGTVLGVIRWVMLGFAGVAVLVGVFLIINTFAMLVAQRTRELGLLRALGAERRQVRRSVLVEALLLGVVGASLGLLAGVGLAHALVRLMGLLGMYLDPADIRIEPVVPVAAYAVGVGVTLVAAALPARRAGRVPPVAALADTEVSAVGRPLRLRAALGAVVAVAGAGALVLLARAESAGRAGMWLAVGVALTLLAAVLAGPALVRPVVRVLGLGMPRAFGPVAVLARRNALRNPRRTGATASALMVGLALVTGLSIGGASITASFDREVDRTLGADFVVQNESFRPFTSEVARRVGAVEGVGVVVRERFVPLRLALPDGSTHRTIGAAVDPELDEVARVEYAAGDTAGAVGADRLALDRRFAARHGLEVGSTLEAGFVGGRTAELRVGALVESGSPAPGGDVGAFLGLPTLERHQVAGQDAVLLVNAADGTGPPVLRERLERALADLPQVQVRDHADYKQLVRDQVAVLLYLVYALLGLAVVIAVLGVVNTLALSVIERTRELGMLRAVGMSRRQLRRMVRLESVVICLFGAVLGLALGAVWGLALHRLLALEGLTVLAVPWWTVAAVAVGSLVVGLTAAVLPALRASRMNVLDAIAHE